MPTGINTSTNVDFLREIWSTMFREQFIPDLIATTLVDWNSEFTDGTTIKIPFISDPTSRAYSEGAGVHYQGIISGMFAYTINNYFVSAFKVSHEFLAESYIGQQVINKFLPKTVVALKQKIERSIWELHKGQSINANIIDGFAHRIDNGASAKIPYASFLAAEVAMDESKVPQENRRAYFKPAVLGATLNDINFIRQDYSPGNSVISHGILGLPQNTIAGFDVGVSTMLDNSTGLDHTAVNQVGVANVFTGSEAFIGTMREEPNPEILSQDKDGRYEYARSFAKWGIALYRPESVYIIITTRS